MRKILTAVLIVTAITAASAAGAVPSLVENVAHACNKPSCD